MKKKYFFDGRCDVVIERGGLGYGDMLALTALFRELKRVNPFARTILKTCVNRINDMRDLMKGQPYPDMIIAKDENVKAGNPSHEFDLSNFNYEYEQKEKPNVTKSRSRVNLDALEIRGNSKPFYLLQKEDLDWVEALNLPRWFIFIQTVGKEAYKTCDEKLLFDLCDAIEKSVLCETIVVSGERGNCVEKVGNNIRMVKCPDIRKGIALMAHSLVCIGFDSVFLHASAALDVPFIGLLGPTSCTGRISDHRFAINVKTRKCDSCFRDSGSVCKETKNKDKSECLSDIDLDEVIKAIEELKKKRCTAFGSVNTDIPGEYYENFDPLSSKFDVENNNLSKIHQPVHSDISYSDAWQKKRVKWLSKHTIVKHGVLDIGCANGYIINSMPEPKKGFKHCGIDYDSDRIRFAKKTKNKDIDFYVLDVRFGLPFPDKKFSTVILAEMLEHLDMKSARIVFEEACRVSNNKVLITMPFAGPDYKESKERIAMVESVDHKWEATEKNIDSLLSGYQYNKELGYFAFIEVIIT